jgi:hypothetical protein
MISNFGFDLPVELKKMSPGLVLAYRIDKLTAEFWTVRVSRDRYFRFSAFIP